jgi:hypothetical protein
LCLAPGTAGRQVPTEEKPDSQLGGEVVTVPAEIEQL